MIVWSEEYEIDIPVIDGQHRRIADYINQVETLKSSNLPRSHTEELLNLLVDYTLSHFEFEEALMEQARYPELEEHQLTHDSFRNQIKTLHHRFQQGEDIAETLGQILWNWLLKHIQEDDASYAPSVRRNILGQEKSHRSWVAQATARYFNH